MYQVGQLIVYGPEGVCRVEAIGPLHMRGIPKDAEYYTLSPLFQGGQIYAPVDTKVFTRPAMTREEAEALIAKIPDIPAEACDTTNPRALGERYQEYLRSSDSLDLVRLLRANYAKGREAGAGGRRLSPVDVSSMERGEKLLHSELAAALDIPPSEVKDYITRSIAARDPASAVQEASS